MAACSVAATSGLAGLLTDMAVADLYEADSALALGLSKSPRRNRLRWSR
jgi:hypothetical protein